MAPRQTSYWLPPYFRRRRGSQLEWFTACLCRHHLETCVPVQAKENARLPGNREQRSCLSVTFDAILLQMGGSFKVSVSLALWEEVNQLRRGIERFCCLLQSLEKHCNWKLTLGCSVARVLANTLSVICRATSHCHYAKWRFHCSCTGFTYFHRSCIMHLKRRHIFYYALLFHCC